ncbi:MAG: TetR/AcrR family transcriptional regulator [Candidatus Binatia bacterium]
MPKIIKVEEKRREILAAAAATFARLGYHGTNLQRVAESAGMGKSSLYHYFPTKEALFAALADAFLHHEADLFASASRRRGDARTQLRSLLDAMSGLFDEWAKVGPLLVDFLRAPGGGRRVGETFRTARRAVARIIRAGQREGAFRAGSPVALATAVLACVDGLFLQELVEPGSTQGARGDLHDSVARLLRRAGVP